MQALTCIPLAVALAYVFAHMRPKAWFGMGLLGSLLALFIAGLALGVMSVVGWLDLNIAPWQLGLRYLLYFSWNLGLLCALIGGWIGSRW